MWLENGVGVGGMPMLEGERVGTDMNKYRYGSMVIE